MLYAAVQFPLTGTNIPFPLRQLRVSSEPVLNLEPVLCFSTVKDQPEKLV